MNKCNMIDNNNIEKNNIKKILFFVFFLLFWVSGCNKIKSGVSFIDNKKASTQKQEKYYIVKNKVVGYFSEEDIKSNNLKNCYKFNMFDRVNYISQILDKTNGDEYYYVETSDKKKCYVLSDNLVEDFVTVIKDNVPIYSFPDDKYSFDYYINLGDYGNVILNLGDFLLVDFRINKKVVINNEEKVVWVGKVWIKKENVSNDIDLFKQANLFGYGISNLQARNYEEALKFFNDALKINVKDDPLKKAILVNIGIINERMKNVNNETDSSNINN